VACSSFCRAPAGSENSSSPPDALRSLPREVPSARRRSREPQGRRQPPEPKAGPTKANQSPRREIARPLPWRLGRRISHSAFAEPVPLPIFARQKPMVSTITNFTPWKPRAIPCAWTRFEWWAPRRCAGNYALPFAHFGKKGACALGFPPTHDHWPAFLHGYFR